jgi:arabinose-5-phosphate isomerase
MNTTTIIPAALRTLQIQSEAISQLAPYINDDFVMAVEKIAVNKGRFVVSGIGKSAIIAQKIVATLNSTGTPSLYMHAADAIHGDLGMIQQDDIVMIISKSGNSPEIKVLIPLVKGLSNLVIGMAGNTESFLATNCDILINTTVLHEACPNNLAPTTSTTAQMVMGDALAVCLMELKGFNSSDFARFHPGGALGKKLYLRVADVMTSQRPFVTPDNNVKQAILQITKSRLGAAAVLDENENICGIVTDGDIRRMLEKYDEFSALQTKDIMSVNPKQINHDALAAEALELMRNNNINQLLVTDSNKFIGVIHIQELLREGII